MLLNPFQPGSDPTVYLSVTTGAQTVNNVSPSGKYTAYRLCNNGTAAINILVFASGVTVTPVTTTSGFQMLAGTVETLTLPVNCSLSIIGAAATVFSITPGEGA